MLRATASQAAAPDNLLGWGIVNAAAPGGAGRRLTAGPPSHDEATTATRGADKGPNGGGVCPRSALHA